MGWDEPCGYFKQMLTWSCRALQRLPMSRGYVWPKRLATFSDVVRCFHACSYHYLQAMEAYDFSTATQRLYAWWQYEVCDVFIEVMKPVMAAADDSEVSWGRGMTTGHLQPGKSAEHGKDYMLKVIHRAGGIEASP